MMHRKKLKQGVRRFLKFTLFIKGIDGIIDLITSIILLFLGSDSIAKIIPFLVRKELIEDPQDFIANHLLAFAQSMLPDTQLFIAIYLALHGLIKIMMALALKNQNSYSQKIAEIVLILFIFYQLYRFGHTHSILLLLFTMIDVMIIFLIHFERKKTV